MHPFNPLLRLFPTVPAIEKFAAGCDSPRLGPTRVDRDRATDHDPETNPSARGQHLAHMTRILIIEDNHDLAQGLANNLEIEGFAVDVVHDGAEGLAQARTGAAELVILDLALPSLDGYRVLSTLRSEGNDVPVLILTARSEEADKVRGFRYGADDYVTKPFGLLELLGRVSALLRRANASS